MPTFGRTGNSKWHIIGPDGCRYGQTFADDADAAPDEMVTATDIVSYDPPEPAEDDQSWSIALSRSHYPYNNPECQRLVLPRAISDTDAGLCNSCRSQLKTQQKRRSRLISGLKRVTPLRNVDWAITEHDSLQVCYWCRAHEATLWRSDALDSRVCPACGRLYNSPLGDLTPDDTPENDRRPVTPSDLVTPIVFGTTMPEYDPTELIGSNRPLITVREKSKYATLKLDLKRTGHAFTPDAVNALRAIQATYAEQVAEDESHQTEVTVNIGMTSRSVTFEGIYPDDAVSVIGDCWDIVVDPSNWFPVGWPPQGRVYVRSADRSIPGDDSVVDTFPRLQMQSPAATVDTDSLKQVTEPGRYQRGERYYTRGAVTDSNRVDDQLQATVQGSQSYDVRVTLEDGQYVNGQCTCPDDAIPCKHIVAAVLASGDVEPIGGDRNLEEIVTNATANELQTLLLNAAECIFTFVLTSLSSLTAYVEE